MAITKISLDNFVVFKHTEVLPCPGVNVFIGKNGVGKTQLMKAIYAKMMSDKDKNRLLAEYFKRGGTSYELNSSLGTQPASIQIEKSTADNKAVFLPVKDMLTHAKGLELSRHKVQIFVSTHNYLFATYFDVRRQQADKVAYHSLYVEENNVGCETKEHFDDLQHNTIMVAKYDAAKTKFDETIAAISAKEAQSARLTAFVKALRERDGIIEDFDESLWGCMVEHITVGRNKEIMVTFRDGTEILA